MSRCFTHPEHRAPLSRAALHSTGLVQLQLAVQACAVHTDRLPCRTGHRLLFSQDALRALASRHLAPQCLEVRLLLGELPLKQRPACVDARATGGGQQACRAAPLLQAYLPWCMQAAR